MSSSRSILIHRYSNSSPKPQNPSNMFSVSTDLDSNLLPQRPSQSLPKIYDYIGPVELRNKLLSEKIGESRSSFARHSEQKQEEKQQIGQMSRSVQTYIRQNSVLSKFSKFTTNSVLKEMTKDIRNMQQYKVQQLQWQSQDKKTKYLLERNTKQPTLLQRSKKHLQIFQNPQKDDLIKNHIVNYWSMSLRNNSLILKRHLKGHNKYSQNEMQSLMQRKQGLKQVQDSMPRLPVEHLNKLKQRQLVLAGRNKLAVESASCDPSVMSQWSNRKSRIRSQLPMIEKSQCLKQQYDSAYRYANVEQDNL